MSESYLSLSVSDRTEALETAADKSGRPSHLLEKDVWVVWTLSVLYNSPFRNQLDQPTCLVPGLYSDFVVNGTSDEPPVWIRVWGCERRSEVPAAGNPVNYEVG